MDEFYDAKKNNGRMQIGVLRTSSYHVFVETNVTPSTWINARKESLHVGLTYD